MHNDTRSVLLQHALPLVPFSGWSEHTLKEAAKVAGLDADSVKQAFPGGVNSCIDYFYMQANEKLAKEFSEESLAALRMPERIKTLVLAYLTILLPHREAVRRAASLRALPWNVPKELGTLYRLIDLIWRLAGDNATDFNFYTKRMTLAAVFSSTLLFWLNDHSQSQKDTKAFLDRRLQNVADFGKWKKNLRSKIA